MHIGVVTAALAALDDEVHVPYAPRGVLVDRFLSAMNDKPTSKPPRTERSSEDDATRAETSSKTNPAFDSWLETKLHKMFDAVASEPLPPDLVKLLKQLDQKTAGKKGKE